MKIRAFITHKKAEQFQDCQDRFCVNPDTKSVAVSDGMSQSIFQKIWAEILVQAYTDNIDGRKWRPTQETNQETIKTKLSPLWNERVRHRVREMQKEGKNTQRTENSLALGLSAGATLAGVRFEGCKWIGEVMGDTCIVEIKDSRITRVCTSQDVNAFDNHPDYFDSNPIRQGKGTPRQFEGELSSEMAMLIVSDPFSDFLLEKQKVGEESEFVKELLTVNSHDAFEELVIRWRTTFGMHNDDSTLLIIEPNNTEEWTILAQDDIERLMETEASPIVRPNETVFPAPTEITPLQTVPTEELHNLQVDLSDARKRCEIAEEDYKRLEEENKRLKEKCLLFHTEQEKLKNRLADKSDIIKCCSLKFPCTGSRSKHKRVVNELIDVLCSKFDFYKKKK